MGYVMKNDGIRHQVWDSILYNVNTIYYINVKFTLLYNRKNQHKIDYVGELLSLTIEDVTLMRIGCLSTHMFTATQGTISYQTHAL